MVTLCSGRVLLLHIYIIFFFFFFLLFLLLFDFILQTKQTFRSITVSNVQEWSLCLFYRSVLWFNLNCDVAPLVFVINLSHKLQTLSSTLDSVKLKCSILSKTCNFQYMDGHLKKKKTCFKESCCFSKVIFLWCNAVCHDYAV